MSIIDEFPEVDVNHVIGDICKEIRRATDYVAKSTRIKEELEARLAAMLEHSEGTQKTYKAGGYMITVKSSINYKLDKEEYEIFKDAIPSEFDPIKKSKKEVITYNIDKSIIRNCKTYASAEILKLLFEPNEDGKVLIEEKPRTLSID